MTGLFLKIVNMSISASWLILVVLALRIVLRKVPKWINVLLWGIVAIRLICPFSIESVFSLIPSAETINPTIMLETVPSVQTGFSVINSAVNSLLQRSFTPSVGDSVNPLQILIPILSIVWVCGAVTLILYTVGSYFYLRKKISEAVRLRDNIFQSEKISPFVFGIFKPKIYLPFDIEDHELEQIVAHEQAHIRRKDYIWKPIGFFLLALYWFNPLIWAAYLFFCRDIELACDESVIKALNYEQRADYMQTLLKCSVNRREIIACPLAFGEIGIKERVKAVMNYKNTAFWLVTLAVVLCIAVALCFLTNPTQKSIKLKIIVPARSEETFVYTDEEIRATKKTIKIWSDDYLGDTEVALLPVYDTSEKIYTAEYLMHGMPVVFAVEKDSWFKVGVNIQNPTDEDIVVYVKAENVEIRIPQQSYMVREWFDYSDNGEGETGLTIAIPEYPGVTFRYTGNQIIASKPFENSELIGHIILIAGTPIRSAYFADITGDGFPDICAAYTYGSVTTDNRIVVFDYVNEESYELSDRGNYDFSFRLNESDGMLYVDKKIYGTNDIIESGRLIFENGYTLIE